MKKKPFVPPTLKEEASLAEVTLFSGQDGEAPPSSGGEGPGPDVPPPESGGGEPPLETP